MIFIPKLNWNLTRKLTTTTAICFIIFLSICVTSPSESRRSWGIRSRDGKL